MFIERTPCIDGRQTMNSLFLRTLHEDEDDDDTMGSMVKDSTGEGTQGESTMGGMDSSSGEIAAHDEMGSMNMSNTEDTSLSGAFLGHFIPAAFFLCFGVFLLLLTARRASQGNLNIPESNTKVLSGIGMTLMICTALGFLVEAIGGWLAKDNLWFQSAHETLYFLFFFAGFCAFLESRGSLPPEASRCGVATALLGEYILWHEHALMKTNMVDQRIHIVLANVSLSNSAITAWSIYQGAQSVIAFVLSYALLVLQGLWLLTAAFNLGINEVNSKTGGFLTHHNVGVIFCVEILAVGFGLVLGTASVYSKRPPEGAAPPSKDSRPIVSKTEEYERLSHETGMESGLEYA